MSDSFTALKEVLERYGQTHLLQQFTAMDEAGKEKLLAQIESIDFELMKSLYKQAKAGEKVQVGNSLEPVDFMAKDELTEDQKNWYEKIGADAIRNGKLAVVTMAGGQGTRLGFDGPKGAFIFDKENNKSIFEALSETLEEAMVKYNVAVPWYIMTSEANHEDTITFFKEHQYFLYPENMVKFFKQGQLPMMSLDGKILLDENGFVKMAADGHGGTLHSLERAGILSQMKADGIEWIFVYGVDNVLVKPVDPLFMGIAIDQNVLGAMKSIAKTDPAENVGVICKKNGKVGVVEYTEISEEMANIRAENGTLVYGDANALFNLYNIKGLEKVMVLKLPYHVALKKADYLGTDGRIIKAVKPNAYKFEMFIFDSYEMFEKAVILRVNREDEFAPIKNAVGHDSPETALALYRAACEKA